MSKLPEDMNFAQRVATFDIDDVVDEEEGVNFEREYLMGGGVQKSSSHSNVALLGDHEAKKDLMGLRIVVISALFLIAMGAFVFYSCQREVDYSDHYYFCVMGMSIGFLTIVCGVIAWVGSWRTRYRDMNPMTLAHSLSVVSLYGYISYCCLLFYYWKDRIILGNIPMDGVNRQFLCEISVGAIAILTIFVVGTLSLKWKTGNVYRWTHYLNNVALLSVGGLLIALGLMTIKSYSHLALWPVCWSIYFSIAAGFILFLTSAYGFFVKSRPRLINFLFLLPLNFIFVGSSYFNYFSAIREDGSRAEELYMSAVIGIASQIVMVFAFVTGLQWRKMLTV